MRRYLLLIGLCGLAASAHASSTLRVGNQVLTAGDSSVRVTELLGKPSSKSHHRTRSHGSSRRGRGHGVRVITDQDRGEQWLYRRDDHVTIVTIVDGRVRDIEDHRL